MFPYFLCDWSRSRNKEKVDPASATLCFLKIFYLVFIIFKYNSSIENWLAGARTLAFVAAACNLASSLYS